MKYCSIACAAKERGGNQSAEKHWNWQGGKGTRFLRKTAPPKPDNCEICGRLASEFKKGLQLDHCHKTNRFRGWLCSNCNTALGLVKEDVATLEALIKYLRKQENHL